jgi:hypothetical protein
MASEPEGGAVKLVRISVQGAEVMGATAIDIHRFFLSGFGDLEEGDPVLFDKMFKSMLK